MPKSASNVIAYFAKSTGRAQSSRSAARVPDSNQTLTLVGAADVGNEFRLEVQSMRMPKWDHQYFGSGQENNGGYQRSHRIQREIARFA